MMYNEMLFIDLERSTENLFDSVNKYSPQVCHNTFGIYVCISLTPLPWEGYDIKSIFK